MKKEKMENGKRIESKGVVKIVILSIVILAMIGIAAVGAYSVENCPKCPESGFSFSATESWCMKSIWAKRESLCCIYHTSLADGYSGGIYVRKYDNLEDAIGDFERERMSTNAERETVLKNSTTEFIFTATDEASLGIEIYGHFLDIEKKIITEVAMEMGVHIYGEIDNSGISDIAETKERFDAFAKCAHSITGWKGTEDKEEYTLTLEHYEPYYESKDGDPRRAGDLVATLKDKNGKGVSGKTVFFSAESGAGLDIVLAPRIIDPMGDFARLFDHFIGSEIGGSYIGHGYTNERGYVSMNYIAILRLEALSGEIRDTGKNVDGKITAVVFDFKTNEIGQKASVDIELSGVAKIITIKSLNNDDPMVRVIPVGSKTGNRVQVLPKQLPYDLLCGDVILLDESDYIEVHWLTGTKMAMKPKKDFLKKDHAAKVCIGGTDIGWRRAISQRISMELQVALTTCPAVIGYFSTRTVGAYAVLPELWALTWSIGDYVYEPLIIECYSTILIDLDKTATVYTVEGTGRLHNIKDKSTTDVTTGHKISVSPDGTFSEVSKFDRSELNEDLSYLLESIEKDESENIVAPVLTPEQSELEISKLYVEKSVYPRKTEVDVQYHIKNIGTVDVDEYHVEYKINDFKGNEVYKFVGSTHSIASGEQQKFIAAENWEIPSDAKIGPYIIDCTLIWDSKRDTAGREFFVTHPAKREDRTAELEISNLYTGKSEYLEGAGERVDVCYYVKNIGTVDISEYHVIYQIFDSEGKRYCWFISDMFGSIVAGKEDKWQSGVWNVPSDAKVGRYTVDAMVIWGLDHFSRETAYFFVK